MRERESSYRELCFSVLARSLRKAWHCSEAISYYGGPRVANKARPTPQLPFPSFSSLFSSPLIPGHCHRPSSSTALAPEAMLCPHVLEDIHIASVGRGKCDACGDVGVAGLQRSGNQSSSLDFLLHQRWWIVNECIPQVRFRTLSQYTTSLSNHMCQWCFEHILTTDPDSTDVGDGVVFNSDQYIIAK